MKVAEHKSNFPSKNKRPELAINLSNIKYCSLHPENTTAAFLNLKKNSFKFSRATSYFKTVLKRIFLRAFFFHT